MFCPECGHAQTTDGKFCSECGHPLPAMAFGGVGEAKPIASATAAPAPARAPVLEPPRGSKEVNLKPRRNYFSRHFHGELSLPVSYWVNGFLLGLVLRGAGVVVNEPGDDFIAAHYSVYGIGVMLFWLAVIAVSIWQLVGIWHSATNYEKAGKPRAWAGLAKVGVVLGLFQVMGTLVSTTIPQIKEYGHIVMGDTANGTYTLRVLRDGTELEVAGPFTFGLTESVKRVLDAQPAVRVIHLNSLGGRVAEARALRDLIEARGLITYTATGCSSACTIAFMAGKERWIDRTAKLGFHQYALPGLAPSAFASDYAKDKRDWEARGVPEAFADRAFATPNSGLWQPTADQLFAAHVITRYAGYGDTAISGLPKQSADLETGLLQLPLYANLRTADRESYDKVIAIFQEAVARGHSMEDVRAQALPIVQSSVFRHISGSSDEAVLAFAHVMMEEMQELYAKTPALCFDYIYGVPGQTEVAVQALSPQVQARELDVMAGLLHRPGVTPVVLSPRDAQDMLKPVLNDLVAKYGAADVAKLGDVKALAANKAKGCQMICGLYSGVLALPHGQPGPVLRYLLAK